MKLNGNFLLKNKIKIIIAIVIVFVMVNFLTTVISPDRQTQDETLIQIENDDIYEIKSKNATYTVVEFFDLDCNHCRDLHFLKKSNMDNLTNVNIILRYYPLLNDGDSAYKALLGECVAKQMGDDIWLKYLDISYTLFSRKGDRAVFYDVSKSLTLNKEDFDTCFLSEENKTVIQNKRTTTLLNQVYEVPSLFIFKDGKFIKKYVGVSGASGIEILKYYNTLK